MVIAKYWEWLNSEIKRGSRDVVRELGRLTALAASGKPVALTCWCAPDLCHGDVVSEIIERVLGAEKVRL